MISISSNLNLMIKAAEKASKIAIRDFGEVEKLQVSKKGPKDFVTKTDKYVEKTSSSEVAQSNDVPSPSDKNDNKIDVEKSLDPETTETNKEK